ncbi:acetate--CoA ligase family protein [Amycolatopsis anabasis]|uniref:acetate--CoA ligase family protein n=1 Tax=Amycolatopsis anabasis TaxID=1840409 RepID=UPI00131B58D7|nr:acetate--CoA ligase family protein [Amycolatopsis anabasis]
MTRAQPVAERGAATGLGRLFAPRSVAVVGASASPDKAGFAMMSALAAFPAVFPVNPQAREIAGRPAFPSVADIPVPVDLAVLTVPPLAVPDVLADCASAGVGAAVVCAGGFAESGADGVRLQERIAEIVADTGIRVLGPNTSGFVDPARGVCANFMPAVRRLRPGPIGIVAQSGGMNLALCFLLRREGIGVSLAVGLGNAVDVGFAEALDHLARDERTRAVALHVEGVADGRALMAAVHRVTEVKPVVAMKVGASDVGEFARSHTGALSGDWAVTRAALTQAGAVVVDTPGELVDAVAALGYRRLPANPDPGVAVVTGQAGPGLFIADRLRAAGIRVPELSEPTVRRVRALLPPVTYQRNPVDTGRPGATFPEVVEAVVSDSGIDATLVYALQEQGTEQIAAGLARPGAATVFVTGGLEQQVRRQRDRLRAEGVPVYPAPDRGVTGMSALVADARARALRAARIANATFGGADVPVVPPAGRFDEHQAKSLLEGLGLPGPRRVVARSHAEARRALAELGGPVVVKVCDARIRHKSDIGAVRVGVHSPEQLDAALHGIDDATGGRATRYLVERQADAGTELIVGAVRDRAFGPVVLLGLGGVDVEIRARTAMRLAPLSEVDARDMVRELPSRVREGARGRPPVPVEPVAALLVQLGRLMVANPQVSEIDVNPVRVTAAGLIALDALVLLD